MSAVAIVRRQVLTLRLRATDRLVEAEVLENQDTTRLRLRGAVAGLRADHFKLGVDIEAFNSGERYAREDVEVVLFDKEKLEVSIRGPIELKHVRRRANFREKVALDARVAPYRGGGVSPSGGLGPQAVMGRTLDLGGGGVSLSAKRSLGIGPGDNVRLEIDIEGRPVFTIARTAWVRERASGHTVAGFAFIEIDERAHDLLYRFLYALQRKRRK